MYGKSHNIDLLWPSDNQQDKEDDEEKEDEEEEDAPSRSKAAASTNSQKFIERKDRILGQTAIHYAAYYGHLEVVKKLVERDEQNVPYIMNRHRETCLISACKTGKFDVVKYLVDKCGTKLLGKVDKLKVSH